MKTIAVHSHKGGVGKTSFTLLLAKYASMHGVKVCILDFDFVGSGMIHLVSLDQAPEAYLDRYLHSADPTAFDIETMFARFADEDKGAKELRVVLNVAWGQSEEQDRLKDRTIAAVAHEHRFGEIRLHTEILIDKLADRSFDLAILDISPGLDFVSRAIRPQATVNVYVTTPNRSDCFGLLEAVNLHQLDAPASFLLFNRAVQEVVDHQTFRLYVESDPEVGTRAKAIFAFLNHLGKKGACFAALPESAELREHYYLGRPATIPPTTIVSDMDECGAKVLELAGIRR